MMYLTLLWPTLGRRYPFGRKDDLWLGTPCLHPELQRFIQLGWRGAWLPRLYAPSVQHQTVQVTAEATLPSAQGRLGSCEKAEAHRPGGLLPGGPSLALISWSARPGEALLVSMPRSLSSLPRLGQLGGAVAAFHTHQGQGDTPDPPETMRLELCGPCGQSDSAPTDCYPRVPQAL